MELKAFVKENTWLSRSYGSTFGWGNGYVCLPEEHPCFGMSYSEIHDKYQINVNGGLTLSESSDQLKWPEIPEGRWWIVGFDTAHYMDDLSRWPDAESVEQEARRLMDQLTNLTPVEELN